MKNMCGGDFEESYHVREELSGPYLTTVKTSCESKDLEKPCIAWHAFCA